MNRYTEADRARHTKIADDFKARAGVQPCNPAEDGVCEALECCKDFNPDWNKEEALRDSLRDHMAMIRADREVMRQALEALEVLGMNYGMGEKPWQTVSAAITTLRERLK